MIARINAKRALAWLQRWIGLTLGLVFVVAGVSGSLLLFRAELLANASYGFDVHIDGERRVEINLKPGSRPRVFSICRTGSGARSQPTPSVKNS